MSSASTESLSDATIKQLASLQEDDEDDEDEEDGTAKGPRTQTNSDWTASISGANRLSSLFGYGSRPTRNTTMATPDKRRSIVSEPKLVAHTTGNAIMGSNGDTLSNEDDTDRVHRDFNELMVHFLPS